MFELTLIGFGLLGLGTFLLLAATWVLVHRDAGLGRVLAEGVFAVAGLMLAGGALVFWASLLLYGLERYIPALDSPFTSIFILGLAGVLTVIMCKPLLDRVRKQVSGRAPSVENSPKDTVNGLIERVRKL